VPRGLRGDPPAAAVRGAASAPLAHAPAQCLAAAHRLRPSLRRWLVCARLVTAERSRARSRGAPGPVAAPGGVLLPRASATCYCRACTPPVAAAGGAPVDVDATPVTRTLVDQLVWTLVASFVNNRKMRSRCDVISGSLCSLVHTRTRRHTSHTDSILPFRHTLHTHVTRPQATSADYTAVHRRQPARLRPTAPRRCGSCAAALVTRRRSPARWSAHAPAATACKRPRARSVVRAPERHSERAMGAALTRPTGITSAPAGARACGV